MILSIRRFLLANIVISVVIVVCLSLLAIFFLEPKKAMLFSLLAYLCLSFLLGVIISYSLGILKKVVTEVSQGSSEYFSPIHTDSIPVEIKPIIEKWNKLLDRLRKASDREKRFMADAAHELKTPLNVLKTYTQIAMNATSLSERERAFDNLLLSVDRSAHVIQQLLTLNNMTYGLALESSQIINLIEEAKEIIAKLVPQALAKKIEIELIASKPTVNIRGNEAAIEILIQNLVDNAIRYTPEYSSIRVVIEEAPKAVILKIIDNGPGIEEHLRGQVFELFCRVIGNKSSGSGLGLSIVKQIVDLHQAVILMGESDEGGGVQVTVTFPKEKLKKWTS